MTNEHEEGSAFHIPTVTEDDLRSFHSQHFGTSAPSRFFVSDAQTDVFEEDELGYYSDGFKRTLTDDQIAMFRHSEVHAILRKRQLARDASETDESDEPTPEVVSHERSANTAAPSETNSGTGSEGASNPSKRKWEHFIDASEANPEYLTHRRMARELDALQQESVDLAYGEEEAPAPPSQTPLRHSQPTMATNTLSNKATAASHIGTAIRLERPTFQWPTLG